MAKEVITYYRKNVPEISEIILVRLRTIENSEDWNDTEILFAGRYKNFPFQIINLQFKSQNVMTEHDYRNLFFSARSWLNQISESEFADYYLKANQYLFRTFNNR